MLDTFRSLSFGPPRLTFVPCAFYVLLAAFSLTFGKNAAAASHAAPHHHETKSHKPSEAERLFLKARDAFERRDLRSLTATANDFARLPEARQHVLAPYLSSWRMSVALMQSAEAARDLSNEVDAFLRQHAGTPMGDALLRDWLRATGKLDWWPAFGTALAAYKGDDLEIACQSVRYRLATDERALLRQTFNEARVLFAAARPAPDACYVLFERAQSEKKLIADADVWKRVRALFFAGHLADARRSAQLASDVKAGFEAASARAHLDPRKFLGQHAFSHRDAAATELAAFALVRLSRTKPGDGAAWLEKNEHRFDPGTADELWAEIATAAAMQHDPDALGWFARVRSAPLSDQQAAWKARAALRVADWTTVASSIAAMNAKEQRETAWRYWLARAKQAAGDTAGAQSLRSALAGEKDFYGLLAAEELGIPPAPDFHPQVVHQNDIERAAAAPGILRALALFRLDCRNEALREWQYALRGMDDPFLLAAAEVARVNGLPDRAISAAERTQTRHDYSQRYPVPHRDQLQTRVRETGLDEAWVYGLIRQESRFMADAKSRAGALGLMQLMPPTAKWAAKQVGLSNVSAADIVQVPINLSLGTFYLKHVLDELGHAVLATAAYNAGPGRARRWRAESPLEGAIYAESIPFNETRDYVKNVIVNQWYYRQRLGLSGASLRDLLGTVPGKQATVLATASPTLQ